MSPQKRTLVAFDDIVGLECECIYCQVRYVVPVANMTGVPTRCPGCNEWWINPCAPDGSSRSDHALICRLSDFLKGMKGRKLGAVLRLEVAGEDMPEPSQKTKGYI